jgi:hypothetical protein
MADPVPTPKPYTHGLVDKAKDNAAPLGGVVAGFLVGGPVGALVGGLGGWLFKTKVQKK